VLGSTPLDAGLSRYYERVGIAGHRVFLRHARDLQDIGRPHLLFIGAEYEDRLDAVFATLGKAPVLTVSDTDGFARRGVAVNLYIEGDQVRFEIARRAFHHHGLQPSYRLLGLARLLEDQQAKR
jgi:hypothetical protein